MNNKQEGTITEKDFENILGNDVVGKSYAKECFELTKQYTSSLLSEKDKEIEEYKSEWKKAHNEKQIAEIKLEKLKSQSGSKSGYGELLEWVEKETDIIRSEADGNSYNVIYSDELIAKILSLSSNEGSKGREIEFGNWVAQRYEAVIYADECMWRSFDNDGGIEVLTTSQLFKLFLNSTPPTSKEGSKAGFSLEDIIQKYCKEFHMSEREIKNNHFVQYLQSLTPPTSKVEAKPSIQEGEKKEENKNNN